MITVDNRAYNEAVDAAGRARVCAMERDQIHNPERDQGGQRPEVNIMSTHGELAVNRLYADNDTYTLEPFEGIVKTDVFLPDGRRGEVKTPTKRGYALNLDCSVTREKVLDGTDDVYILTWPAGSELGLIDVIGWATRQEMADAPLVNWKIGQQLSIAPEQLRTPESLAPMFRDCLLKRTPYQNPDYTAIVKQALRDGRLRYPDQCSKCATITHPVPWHVHGGSPYDIVWLCQACGEKEKRQ